MGKDRSVSGKARNHEWTRMNTNKKQKELFFLIRVHSCPFVVSISGVVFNSGPIPLFTS